MIIYEPTFLKMRHTSSALYQAIFFLFFLISAISCKQKNTPPSAEAISELGLKQGRIISCGPAGEQFGSVNFKTSCSAKGNKDFNFALSLLHSFEYDEAEKAFAKIIAYEPECAMAYWGVAMSNYHLLWPSAPSPVELTKGAKAIAIAQSIKQKSPRESDYINAIAVFYKDWDKVDHQTRCLNYSQAMKETYRQNPDDKEAAIFYALSLDAAADPADKTYTNQKKAGEILNALYPNQPDHPGIVHYVIHSYDYPELATLALPAARKYASIAPSSAHAQHMPSHIFTRLGLWDEAITSNLASTSSAKCYAETSGMKAHWDEELHGMDYLVYAYLQKGDNKLAKEQFDYLESINEVFPVNFKDAYAFAAIPSRYMLENKNWREAANLQMHPANFPWKNFPWQKAIVHYTRVLGNVNLGNVEAAKAEFENLRAMHDTLMKQKDLYKANQVQVQVKSSEAWITFKEGRNDEAIALMNTAADLEDKTEKSPVTPGEVIPAKELLADMLLRMNKPAEAFEVYEASLKKHPNRFNGLYGAALAAEKSAKGDKANYYYQQLIKIAGAIKSNRPELEVARLYLKQNR
jgi:tetratricopeptide (TPR) repeat protein